MQSTKFTKAVLAVALAGAFAAPAMAQSSVTVGGLFDTYVGSMQNADNAKSKVVVNSGGMTTSYIGFSGVEDLGSGLKAKFVLNAFLQGDTGAAGRFPGDTLFSRDANLTLSGGFGEVQVGRGLAPNFLPTILFNPFGDSFAFSPLVLRTLTSTINGDTGWSNQIKYTTPSIGGLTVNLHYQLGEVVGNTSKNNVGINALYFNGPLSLTAYYHEVEVKNPGGALDTSRQKASFVGGAYDFGLAKLFATYDETKNNAAVISQDKSDTTSIGVSVPVGAGKVLAGYAVTNRTIGTASEVKSETATVGYDYFISKRTDLYSMLMSNKVTKFDDGTSFGVGIRHRF